MILIKLYSYLFFQGTINEDVIEEELNRGNKDVIFLNSGQGNYRTYPRTVSAIANYIRKWNKEKVKVFGSNDKNVKKLSTRRVKAIIQENVQLTIENVCLAKAKRVRDGRIAKLKNQKDELLIKIFQLETGVSISNPTVDIPFLHLSPEEYPQLDTIENMANDEDQDKAEEAADADELSKDKKKKNRTKKKLSSDENTIDIDTLVDEYLLDDVESNVQKSNTSEETSTTTREKRQKEKKGRKSVQKPDSSKVDILKVKLPKKKKKAKILTDSEPSTSSTDAIQHSSRNISEEILLQNPIDNLESSNFTLDDEDSPMATETHSISEVVDEIIRLEDMFENDSKKEVLNATQIMDTILDEIIQDIIKVVLIEDCNDKEDSTDNDKYALEIELDSEDEFLLTVSEESQKAAEKAKNRTAVIAETSTENFSQKPAAKNARAIKPSSSRKTSLKNDVKKSKSKEVTLTTKQISSLPQRTPSPRSGTVSLKKHVENKIKSFNDRKKPSAVPSKSNHPEITPPAFSTFNFKIPKTTAATSSSLKKDDSKFSASKKIVTNEENSGTKEDTSNKDEMET